MGSPRTPPSLVLWVGPSLGTRPHPHPKSGNLDTGLSKEQASVDFPNCADISEPRTTSLPCPLAQVPHEPSLSIQRISWAASAALGWPRRTRLQNGGHGNHPVPPSCPPNLGAQKRWGLERSRLWYREAGGVGKEPGDTSHLWKGVQSTS